MNREKLIKYLKKHNIPYRDSAIWDRLIVSDAICVYDKAEFEKDEEGFVPYLRISHFDKKKPYTRDCGIVGYKSWKWIMKKVKELGGVK